MSPTDRRAEFQRVTWQQGRLLLTDNTRRWSQSQRDNVDTVERCMAFANFSAEDEGRSRILLYRFATHEECQSAVTTHNEILSRLTPDRQ